MCMLVHTLVRSLLRQDRRKRKHMLNWHIQKFSDRPFGACIIFFNALHSKFAFIHKCLLFETYTGHVQNDY